MIDKQAASQQMERMAGLDWYPREGRAQIELIQAIEAAENEFIAAYVVGEWIKYHTECAKPADIRALIWEENNKLAQIRYGT